MYNTLFETDVTELSGSSPRFLVKCGDHAMINAFIPPGAELMIDPLVDPVNGNIVLAELNKRVIVRFIQINKYKSRLIAANSKFPDIEMRETHNLKILGVVSRIIINPLLLKMGL